MDKNKKLEGVLSNAFHTKPLEILEVIVIPKKGVGTAMLSRLSKACGAFVTNPETPPFSWLSIAIHAQYVSVHLVNVDKNILLYDKTQNPIAFAALVLQTVASANKTNAYMIKFHPNKSILSTKDSMDSTKKEFALVFPKQSNQQTIAKRIYGQPGTPR